MIILRDRKQEQRELTAEEIKQFGIIQSAQSSAMRKGVTTVGGRHKFAIEEKAMKIVVKKY